MAPIRLPSMRPALAAIGAERLGPRRRAQLAAFPDIGTVEPLGAQAVDDVPGLVGNPLLVHGLVDARQDPHHLAAAGIDPDRGADAVHHVDRLGLAEFPGPRREGIGF